MQSRTFTASDGYPLHYEHWPVSEPVCYVVALHGMQSHAGWYHFSSELLCKHNFDVRFLDRRGSGRNAHDRGHTIHADRLVTDVSQFLGKVRHERDRRHPKAPVVLLGLSWGGRLAAVVASRRPELVDAMVLLYPGICARVRPTWMQKRLLRLGNAAGAAKRPIAIPLDDPALFTDDPRSRKFIADDPLALRSATVAMLNAGAELESEARRAASKIQQPILLMLAGRDRIIDVPRTYRWFARLASRRRTVIEFPSAAHTLEFEPNREAIFMELVTWLRSQSGSIESG